MSRASEVVVYCCDMAAFAEEDTGVVERSWHSNNNEDFDQKLVFNVGV